LEYGLFRLLSAVLLVLPEGVALRLGSVLGWSVGSVLRIRRADVERNLEVAFPERPPAWRRRVARASYVHLGREAVALFRLAGMSPTDVVARTEIRGLEALQGAVQEGRGVVVVTGHLGNWEIGGAALSARGLPVDAVAKGMANRRFDRDLIATRERLGMQVVDMGHAHREVLRSLRRGHVVALVADQNAHKSDVFVPFFGRLAATHRGPAVFALRSGAPVFVGTCIRRKGSPQRYVVTLEPLQVKVSGDADRDVVAVTAAHTALLEEAVRAAPEQYFWQHKRWKTRPPEEPAPGGPV
jgi:KDO2-lipid IV(A) lauroyltransferase